MSEEHNDRESQTSDNEPGEPRKESLVSAVISMAILVALVFAFKSSILDANNIPSGSMIPTLKIGDYLFVNKMRYSVRIPFTEVELARIDDPARGDIITFIPPGFDEGKHYVKRVVGMPGDHIRIKNRGACELLSMLEKKRQAAGGKKVPGGNSLTSTSEKTIKREFKCSPRGETRDPREPRLDFVEYRVNGRGPWRNYLTGLIDAGEARKILIDADDTSVLHPDVIPIPNQDDTVAVLFQESVGGVNHLIVESNKPFHGPIIYSTFCKDISTEKGCAIPAGNYFVMGDNRDDSKDSRFIGLIKRDKILGKALVIYFSINWYDKICQSFVVLEDPQQKEGFKLPMFPPREQKKYCRGNPQTVEGETVRGYFARTIRHRLPRMSVRWPRLFTLLK